MYQKYELAIFGHVPMHRSVATGETDNTPGENVHTMTRCETAVGAFTGSHQFHDGIGRMTEFLGVSFISIVQGSNFQLPSSTNMAYSVE